MFKVVIPRNSALEHVFEVSSVFWSVEHVSKVLGLDDFGKEMHLLPLLELGLRLASLLSPSQFTALMELNRSFAQSCC